MDGIEQKRQESNVQVLEWLDALLLALALVLFLLLFFVRTIRVDGRSMQPTLWDNNQLLVQSIAYTPARGDIVVVDGFTSYGSRLVKRVIGVGGDTVDIDFNSHEVTAAAPRSASLMNGIFSAGQSCVSCPSISSARWAEAGHRKTNGTSGGE